MAVRSSHPLTALGFTLVEMLIALTIMAVMAGLSWQGLDAMSKSRQQNQAYQTEVLTLATALAQWGADWDAVVVSPPLGPAEADGQHLRMTRRSALHDPASESLVVVAYAQVASTTKGQGLDWLRWQSAPATTAAQLQTRWAQAQQWFDGLATGQTAPGVHLARIQGWRLRTWQEGAWAVNAPGMMGSIPEALRLEIDLSDGQPLTGTLRRDWIRPTAGGTR